MLKINLFFKNLFESGVDKAFNEEDKVKIRYLNQGMIYGAIMFLPDLFFEAYLGFLPATILNLIFILSVIICFFLNRTGNYKFSRNFTFIGLDLILLTANFIEGTRTGNYLIYLALVLLFPIFIKLNEKGKEVIFLFSFTALCLLTSLIVCPQEGYLQGLSNDDAAKMFKANFGVSFGLTSILAYIIFILTKNREDELIKAKEKAEESEKIKMQFISNMSHELRTPLNGIIGSTNLLKLDEHSKAQKEQFDMLSYSSKHMLHLVNDVLDFSKIESGKLKLENRVFNLQNFINNIYLSFASQFEQKGLFFNVIQNNENIDYTLLSDDIRLSQILNNLLSNALKFTHVGGVDFEILTEQISLNKINISFKINDTGIGIKENNLTKIFESFVQADLNTTRNYGGTGLGLSISKNLVEIFNSKLIATSEIDKGSVFSFTTVLTIVDNKGNVSENEQLNFESLNGMKILIAEDNKINMLIAKKFLLKWGAKITEAENGSIAIDKFTSNYFDLLLLDLEMPIKDGYTALKEIREVDKNIPAIAFTAAVIENIHSKLLQQGFNDYVMKPFEPKDLHNKIFKYYLNKEDMVNC
jgi:signal transduction histidine kinase/CheY-like chemotaxis protein